MADEYTPTTEQVRSGYVWLSAGDNPGAQEEASAEFWRWLAAHDRETAARALAPIRDALTRHPRCGTHPDDDTITCGWKSVVASIQWAIDQAPDQWLRDTLARAWDEGERHEAHTLTTLGQFCPHGTRCNPYREGDPT